MSDTEKEPDTSSIPTLVADDDNQDGATMYKYRDFGNVPEDQEVEASPSPSPPPSSRGSLESSIRVQKFPVKLYAILAQKEFQDIITWMPHGRSWKVLKPNLFESLVMPLFFEYSNYHSFNRLVNAWSFRRISSGPDRGSYYHEVSSFLCNPCCSVRAQSRDQVSNLPLCLGHCSYSSAESHTSKSTCAGCPKPTKSFL